MNILWIFFFFWGGGGGGSSNNWTGLRGHFYAFCHFFSLSQCTEWGYFFGLLKFQIFYWVCLIIPDIYFGKQLMADAGSKPTYEEI